MSRFKFVNLIDKVFISVSIFLIIYAWINFFIRDLWITFVLSLVFSSACIFLLFYVLSKKTEKKENAKKYYKDLEEKFLAFRLMKKQDKLKLLNSIIKKEYETKLTSVSLTYVKDEKQHQIIIATNIEKLSDFELVNLLEKVQIKTKIVEIVCNEILPNLNTKIFTDLQIVFINKKKLYDEYFLRYNIFPDTSKLNTQKEKINIKKIAKNFFIPSKAKSYFLCGLILIFSSIILPYHYYYLIFGSLLLTFSIFCKLQPFFNHQS